MSFPSSFPWVNLIYAEHAYQITFLSHFGWVSQSKPDPSLSLPQFREISKISQIH